MSRTTLEEVIKVAKRLIELLSPRFRVSEAYVFGSYVRGTWLRTSDIDLVIVSPDFEGIPFLRRLDIINEIQWRAGIRPYIEAIPLTPSEFFRKIGESAVLRDASRYWIKIDL